MKQSTKQRIVGSVVLLALALIFIPLVFDGQGSYQQPLTSRIPEPPLVEVLSQPVPTRPLMRDNSNTRDANNVIAVEPDPRTELTDFGNQGNQGNQIDQPDIAEANADNNTDVVTADPNIVPVVESEPDIVDVPPGLDADGLPQGWSVRLGSFKEEANANSLLERLRTSGYKAYSRKFISTQGELTGVFVGPWVDRAAVEEYRQQLQKDFRLSGIVVRFGVDQL